MSIATVPGQADLAAFYKDSYYGFGATKFVTGAEQIRNLFIKRRANDLLGLMGEKRGRVLDIGCGSGTFLHYLGLAGCEIHGTELEGPAFERAGRVPSIHLGKGEMGLEKYPADFFDAITLWHVLEHLRDPFDILRRCCHLLAGDGVLVVEVPDIDSWQGRIFGNNWLHLDPPRHLYQFTGRALKQLVHRCGFEIIGEENAAFEMGAVGALQGWLNGFIKPRDLFYDMLRTRNKCRGKRGLKLASVVLSAIAAPLACLFALSEIACGSGVICRYTCRKKQA
jgi:SAM-dependent methyltransferase